MAWDASTVYCFLLFLSSGKPSFAFLLLAVLLSDSERREANSSSDKVGLAQRKGRNLSAVNILSNFCNASAVP